MKVLFVTLPGLGHFFPVVPLAWALRAAGHEVLFVTGYRALDACGQAGLPAVDACPGAEFTPPHGPGDLRLLRDPFSGPQAGAVAGMFGRINDLMADRTVMTARWWKPDLIVHTPFCLAGALAAALGSVEAVVHGFGLVSAALTARFNELIYEAARSAFERHGLAHPPGPPAAVIDTCPRSMREPGRPPGWASRYVPYNGGGRVPDWLLEPSGRPLVCVTLGTAVPHVLGVGGAGAVMEAVRGLEVEVVLALGDADPSALGVLPPNVRLTGWVPLSALLPACSVIVHHGGAGTTMNAVAAGVPQLVLPHMADQHLNAQAVVRRGIGLSHLPEETGAAEVRDSLDRLLSDQAFVRAAREVREENEGEAPPAALVRLLAELAGKEAG